MSSLPLRYWCHTCGGLLFRSDAEASALIEAVCQNRRCGRRGPRVVRVPEDACDRPVARGDDLTELRRKNDALNAVDNMFWRAAERARLSL